jgi:glyoxylase-like metal-dependent hydrolase (beta-lactamase superfamily II)
MADMTEATLASAADRTPHERVHAITTGRLMANRTFLRGEGFGSLLRRVEPFEFPVLAYVIEHADGLIVVDTGLGTHVTRPRSFRGFPPAPATSEELEIGPQMRARGLDPAEVGLVVLTHLDWDHTGGLGHFPHAEVLVHRPEHDFARTRPGRFRCRPSLWPHAFAPTVYDLDREPYGPFPESRAITGSGDLRVVPIAGHSPGQVAVAYDTDAVTLLFAGDHALRADWFAEDLAADRLVMLGPYAKRDARETSRRLRELAHERPIVLLPAHDADAPERLARRERLRL